MKALACWFVRLLTVLLISGEAAVNAVAADEQPLGEFEAHGDIGSPRHSGGAAYDAERDEFVISGSGTNMWDKRDQCQFVWKKVTGDFVLSARMKFVGAGVDPHRKIGWMVRQNMQPDSPYADVAVHGDGLTSLQFRRKQGELTEEVASEIKAPDVVQLERVGQMYRMSVARDGEPLVGEEIAGLELGEEVYVGLFVCAHNANVVESARFDNVRITVPAPADFVPYQDYVGSRLEILNLESGHRTVVSRVDDSLQAPNWTVDGKALIYNRNGRLYRFDLASRSAEEIDTDFATNNNNDHVLSFDGEQLAISHQDEANDGRSVIYTLPTSGGTPKQVTAGDVQSYLHGWTPDAKTLVFTGVRNGATDIYVIPSAGGDEKQLTVNAGLNDGPEYSPDGKTIYFNSSRSGKMQIWRMNPDGSDQRQVTDDGFNNWFPHVSPDGKWIAFLSFLPEVPPEEHPFYKHVYLRLMPVEGGEPRVIAYVYGGQGTINVPSWSPDSRALAFVSNTQ